MPLISCEHRSLCFGSRPRKRLTRPTPSCSDRSCNDCIPPQNEGRGWPNNCFLLASAEATALGSMPPRQRIDLSHLAAEAAGRWLHPSLQAGQDLGFELASAWVVGDPLLLEELLGNLVHNAIEHAGSGSRITIRTGMRDGCSELCVEDDGRGIPADQQASVWQRFRRGRGAEGTGSGLGLAIVKDIARLHGAQATLAAGECGRGLRVCIRFPQTPAAAPADG